ncbi:SMI1/KNR4 family protein [Prevotella sp. 10(H)]|uniref:SMI1/KNR4 family protein n=1 Tax=Prevotella sp. 10(H) TaxID=1158294 RepID=UPI000A8EC11C|nr:SMI1/KNR4 family protein [Prevotella sp. 10(H)]
MKTILSNLENHLIRTKNPIENYLNENDFIQSHFVEVLNNLGLKATEELIELYSWRNGLDAQKALDINFEIKLFSMGTYIDYRSTSSLLILEQHTSKCYENKYLPIIYNGILEDPILIDLKPGSKTYGQLFYYSPKITLSMEPISIYDSLSTWLQTMNECYEKNVYSVNTEGFLEEKSDEEALVSKRLNPESMFWLD